MVKKGRGPEMKGKEREKEGMEIFSSLGMSAICHLMN